MSGLYEIPPRKPQDYAGRQRLTRGKIHDLTSLGLSLLSNNA